MSISTPEAYTLRRLKSSYCLIAFDNAVSFGTVTKKSFKEKEESPSLLMDVVSGAISTMSNRIFFIQEGLDRKSVV